MGLLVIEVPESVERYLDSLAQDLLRLDVDDVGQVAGEAAPDGSRSGVANAVATIGITLAPSLPLLGAVVRVATAWMKQVEARSVKMQIDGHTLELQGGVPDVDRKVEAFLKAVQSRDPQ